MPLTLDLTAWTATLLGLYLTFAGVGVMRVPTAWRTMITEVGASPALQLFASLIELLVGSLIYLSNPWIPSDLLSCALKAAGGLLMLEALVVAGFCDVYAQFLLRTLDYMHRGWAMLMIGMGVILSVAGMIRFG